MSATDPRFKTLEESYYLRPAEEVAADLLGRFLVRRIRGRELVLRIVETEAYLGARDRASHAWGGRRTRRTETLFRRGGCAYVYLIYGIHNCLNVVTGIAGEAGAVLLRAGEAVQGAESMQRHRKLVRTPGSGDLAGGPGKLCQALAVTRKHDAHLLSRPPLLVTRGEPVSTADVVRGPRVGIGYAGAAAGWPLRFAIRGNAHVSRPRLKTAG